MCSGVQAGGDDDDDDGDDCEREGARRGIKYNMPTENSLASFRAHDQNIPNPTVCGVNSNEFCDWVGPNPHKSGRAAARI